MAQNNAVVRAWSRARASGVPDGRAPALANFNECRSEMERWMWLVGSVMKFILNSNEVFHCSCIRVSHSEVFFLQFFFYIYYFIWKKNRIY